VRERTEAGVGKALSESFGVKQKIISLFRPARGEVEALRDPPFVATTSGVVLRRVV